MNINVKGLIERSRTYKTRPCGANNGTCPSIAGILVSKSRKVAWGKISRVPGLVCLGCVFLHGHDRQQRNGILE